MNRLSEFNQGVARILADLEAAHPRNEVERYLDEAVLQKEMELVFGTGPSNFGGIGSPQPKPSSTEFGA